MTFAVEEFHDLIRLLEQAPEWRADLRRVLLTEELLSLPEITRELVEAQRRTEERLEQLAEAQRRTEERLEALTARVEQLAEAQRRTEARVEQLAEAQRRTEARVEQLAEAQRRTEEVVQMLVRRTDRLIDDVGHLKGSDIERRYRERAPSYFARILQRIHALSVEEVAALIEIADTRGGLDEAGREAILETDLIVQGLRRTDGEDIYLAVEISAGIGVHDVDRAADRAYLLAELTGKPVIPVVAGQSITREAAERAAERHAWRVLDGRAVAPAVAGGREHPSDR
jgi:hypothetical protein